MILDRDPIPTRRCEVAVLDVVIAAASHDEESIPAVAVRAVILQASPDISAMKEWSNDVARHLRRITIQASLA